MRTPLAVCGPTSERRLLGYMTSLNGAEWEVACVLSGMGAPAPQPKGPDSIHMPSMTIAKLESAIAKKLPVKRGPRGPYKTRKPKANSTTLIEAVWTPTPAPSQSPPPRAARSPVKGLMPSAVKLPLAAPPHLAWQQPCPPQWTIHPQHLGNIYLDTRLAAEPFGPHPAPPHHYHEQIVGPLVRSAPALPVPSAAGQMRVGGLSGFSAQFLPSIM